MPLSVIQWRFLARRVLCPDDAEACTQLNFLLTLPAQWRTDPIFAAAEAQAFADQQEFSAAYSRQLLGKAVSVLDVAMDATTPKGHPDWKARLTAASTVLKLGGMMTEQISVTVRDEAKRLAAELGLDVAEVLAEADSIVREKQPVQA